MFRTILSAMLVCAVYCSPQAIGAEIKVLCLKTDGTTLTIYCHKTGNGTVGKQQVDEILASLDHLDGSIDVRKKTIFSVGDMLRIEIPANTPALTMSSTECRETQFVSDTIQERTTRTYRFKFEEKQRGVPISLGDMRRFVFKVMKKGNDEIHDSEVLSETESVIKITK